MGPCDQEPAGSPRKKEKQGPAVESSRLALKARGGDGLGDIKRTTLEGCWGVNSWKWWLPSLSSSVQSMLLSGDSRTGYVEAFEI